MNDLSLIRLEPSFDLAKETRPNQDAEIGRFDQIVLRLGSSYMQTTNTELGIAFDGNYQVLIVNSCDKELHNITSHVAIEEFIDKNGLNQIHFEIIPNKDFWAIPVFLKFIHTVSDLVWYSNPIVMTDYDVFYTTRFDYKPNATDIHFKSIELQCKRQQNDIESSSKEYRTDEGIKRVSRLIPTEFEQYLFDNIDNATYRRLNLDLLSAQVVYINGYRMTDKFTVNSKAQKGVTNVFQIDFKPAITYKEKYNSVFQLFEPFDLVGLNPFGDYTSQIHVQQSDLTVLKTASDLTPYIGTNIVFTILARNTGMDNATGVVVNDLLPSGFVFVGYTASNGVYNQSTGIWTIGNLANGLSETLQITVNVASSGVYTNTAVVTGNEYDPTTGDNTSSITIIPINISINRTFNNNFAMQFGSNPPTTNKTFNNTFSNIFGGA